MVFIEYLLVGVAGSLLLIALAKGFMAKALQRDNDYYKDQFDKGGEADE